MKKNNFISINIFLFCILIISFVKVYSQTTISAGNVSGTWTLGGSPYLINGHILIPNDSILTIEPGVIVIFQGQFKLNVKGTIIAIGTATDSITFMPVNTVLGWMGFKFENTLNTNDSSKIIYSNIKYCNNNDGYGGAFVISSFSKLIISHNTISNCNLLNFSAGGSAIMCYDGNPTINYNIITNNDAGGGIINLNSSNPIFHDNIISNNNGKGIYLYYSHPLISNNQFLNNQDNEGSSIYLYSSHPTIENNILDGNTGTAIYCYENSMPTINNNTFKNNNGVNGGAVFILLAPYGMIISNNQFIDNSATNGGAIYTQGSNTPITITNNIFENNFANDKGGAIYLSYVDRNIIANNIFSNNTANDGGGLYIGGGNELSYEYRLKIYNNIIVNNRAINGAGIYNYSGNFSFINNTISNNAADNGGAIFFNSVLHALIYNSILFGNTALMSGSQVHLESESTDPFFYFCNLEGGLLSIGTNGNEYTGDYMNNINLDPLFVSPTPGSDTIYNGLTADWSLQNTSLCIDAGTSNISGITLPNTDIISNPRIAGCNIDIGAYEYYVSGVTFLINISQSIYIICNGDSTATLNANATGGTQPYSYLWSNGDTTASLNNISAGNYSVTVSNADGCTKTTSYLVSQPSAINPTTNQTNIDCSGNCIASATVSASGGTPPFTYLWSTVPAQTTPSTTATLCTGSYFVTVTDNQGCTKTASVLIASPSSLTFTYSSLNVNCFSQNNGSIVINATGGSGTKQFSKDGGTNYQLSNNFTGLVAATYNLVVKDGNGCQTSNIPVDISEPTLLTDVISKTDIDCYGATNGTATINISGGTQPYIQTWSTIPVQSTSTIINLSSSTYYVTVTDNHGCNLIDSVSIAATLPNFQICLVTVDTITWKNQIMWESITGLNILGFNVFKEIATNVYSGIGFVSYGSPCVLIDYSSNPVAHGDKYKISAIDSCATESIKSPFHKTMNLTIAAFGSTMGLNWDQYVDESGIFVPAKYYIYRGSSPSNMSLLDSISGSFTSYNDANVFDVYYYIIGVKKDPPCNINGALFSFSNQKDNSTLLGINSSTFGHISISPNPASNEVVIEVLQNFNLCGTICEICNTEGKIVRKLYLKNQKTKIDIKDLNRGFYTIKLISDKEIIVKKLIKQ